MPTTSRLESLPLELTQSIIRMSGPADFENIALVSRYMHSACLPLQDEYEMCRRGFAHISIEPQNSFVSTPLPPVSQEGLSRSVKFGTVVELVQTLAMEPRHARWIKNLDLRYMEDLHLVPSEDPTDDKSLLRLLDMQSVHDIPDRFATVFPDCCENTSWDHIWSKAKTFGDESISVFSLMLLLHCLPSVRWIALPPRLQKRLSCFDQTFRYLWHDAMQARETGVPGSLAKLEAWSYYGPSMHIHANPSDAELDARRLIAQFGGLLND